MKFIMNMSLRKTALQIIRGMAIDATLGATCGALYGFVFGGLGAIVHDEVGRLVVIAGYLGWCGAVAGALVGACGAILNSGEKTADTTPISPEVAAEQPRSAAAVRHLLVPSQRQRQDSLPTGSASDRRRIATAASNHPLSC